MDQTITPQAIREISAAALTSEKTTRRAYGGKPCKPSTYERLKRAATALSLPLPPDPREGA